MSNQTIERVTPQPELILANWRNELDSANLYRHLAAHEDDAGRAALLTEMADAESRHAAVMERGLREIGVAIPPHRLGFRARALKTLASLLGPRAVYPLITSFEMNGSAEYAGQDARTAALAPEERSHARTLGQLDRHAAPERWHRSSGGGSLRAAVFGINDGLVSNLSLVMGFAGAAADSSFVLLAGLSGLLAGASSMAAGEYVSVKAQRELFERQIELEAAELSVTPEEETEELALIYRAKGMTKADAERIAGQLTADPDVALDSLVREELGLDPSELGSPIGAAVSSFLAFSVGAVLPVIPFFLGAAFGHVVASLVIACLALFTVGALISIFTGRSVIFSGGRQLLIGLAAAAITFALGSVIGAATGV
ncbi:MAG: VIT1/CCC1 transporter family protein [Dehalococcoidia bacterium]